LASSPAAGDGDDVLLMLATQLVASRTAGWRALEARLRRVQPVVVPEPDPSAALAPSLAQRIAMDWTSVVEGAGDLDFTLSALLNAVMGPAMRCVRSCSTTKEGEVLDEQGEVLDADEDEDGGARSGAAAALPVTADAELAAWVARGFARGSRESLLAARLLRCEGNSNSIAQSMAAWWASADKCKTPWIKGMAQLVRGIGGTDAKCWIQVSKAAAQAVAEHALLLKSSSDSPVTVDKRVEDEEAALLRVRYRSVWNSLQSRVFHANSRFGALVTQSSAEHGDCPEVEAAVRWATRKRETRPMFLHVMTTHFHSCWELGAVIKNVSKRLESADLALAAAAPAAAPDRAARAGPRGPRLASASGGARGRAHRRRA
jgi:hypothetical protein